MFGLGLGLFVWGGCLFDFLVSYFLCGLGFGFFFNFFFFRKTEANKVGGLSSLSDAPPLKTGLSSLIGAPSLKESDSKFSHAFVLW